MRRYLAIILVLLAAAVGILAGVGWRLGSIVPFPVIAREQQADHKLLWLGAFEDYASYKLARIKVVQPEVLLVGSSRCGQARHQVFRPYETYNACLTAWPLQHVVDFIDQATRVSKPRVVIVALDYFLFGDGVADTWQKERSMDYRQGIASYKRKLRNIFDFMKRNGWNISAIGTTILRDQFEPIDGNRLIGTEAIRGHFGFRDDGSVFVAPVYRTTSAHELSRGADHIVSAFPGAPHLSEVQFQHLIRLSKLAHDRGFSVVAIQYPLLKSATDFLDTDPTYRPYAGLWLELRSEATAKRLTELGIKFFDMSRDPLSADPENFFDPAHPSERGVLRTIIALTGHKDFSDLFPQIDKRALESDLTLSRGEPFDLYH